MSFLSMNEVNKIKSTFNLTNIKDEGSQSFMPELIHSSNFENTTFA